MKYLNSQTLRQVISPLEVIAAVEKAMVLYETPDYFMPQRPHFDRGENTLLLMPCFTPNSFGTKLVSVFPQNTLKGLPAIQGLMVLNSAETGEVLAILDVGTLTALRTAAIGAVSVKYLAKKEVKSLGVIGTGRQGIEQAIFTSKVRGIEIFGFSIALLKGCKNRRLNCKIDCPIFRFILQKIRLSFFKM